MASVNYVNATRIYPGNPVPAVNKLNLDIADGEFMVLVGPSGSGKSTALRMLAGLEEVNQRRDPASAARTSRSKPPKDRDIAMVFQNYALYPHMTRRREHGLRAQAQGRLEGGARPRRSARPPSCSTSSSTSTASRRRSPVASASASRWAAPSCASPACSSWTSRCRTSTPSCASRPAPTSPQLQARLGTTTLYVTHDQVEAMTMGHRVALLKDGILQQVDTPRNLYDRPANAFVAGFIGSPAMNLRDGRRSSPAARSSATSTCRCSRRCSTRPTRPAWSRSRSASVPSRSSR